MRLRVSQLTVDHDLGNTAELARLAALGLNVDVLRARGRIGEHHNTRTLGDYNIKSGYREFDYLRWVELLLSFIIIDSKILITMCLFYPTSFLKIASTLDSFLCIRVI